MIAVAEKGPAFRNRPPHHLGGVRKRDARYSSHRAPYDPMDRLATRKDALNRQETYQYDPAGNLSQFTDRKNQVTTFTYDNLNRRTTASYHDGSSTSFTYDSVGRLARATDSIAGTIEFSYDNLDRLSQETTPQGTVAYQYDALGRRTTMTANGATPVAYGYDAASRLIQIAQAGLVVGLSYDAASRRTGLTYPNGTSTSYSYDNAARVTNITHNGSSGIIESLSYVYDAAGNRISLTRTNGTASNLPAAVQAAYDAANEQIQFNAGSPNQTFDANGNLTSDGANTYTWDARNRLVAISGPGLSASFSYDALGRRINKIVNGVTTSYLYDGNDIVQEIGGSAVGANYVRSQSVDEAFVRQTASGDEFYHTDALGSSLALSNAAGAAAVNYSYEAFGKTTMAGTSTNSFQYTGRENDGTGLYYYHARYYGPTHQRFTSEDPIKFPISPLPFEYQNATLCSRNIESAGPFLLGALFQQPQRVHPYAYVNNNPLGMRDPLGFGPSSECVSYLKHCTDVSQYACYAFWVCSLAGDSGPANCLRNCLLDKFQQGCTTWRCQFTGGKSSGGAHGDCAVACTIKQLKG